MRRITAASGTLTHALLEDVGGSASSPVLDGYASSLGTDDLFSLLHALRPVEFREADVLAKTLADHQGFSKRHD